MNIPFSNKKKPTRKPILRMRTVRKRVAKYGIASLNVLLIASVIGFLVYGRSSSLSNNQTLNNQTSEEQGVVALDQISSADIAANIAVAARLPEADQVRNQADSRNALVSIAVSDDVVVNKPQIISAAASGSQSRRDIIEYTALEGDTIQSLAEKFNVSSDSIRWSNSLSGDRISAGKVIMIPPKNRNGLVYKVTADDTIEKLAEKYKTTIEKIIAFNDLELTNSLPVNEFIFIPDGEQPPEPVQNNTSFGNISIISNFTPRFGGNGYSFGYCTYWTAGRRAEIGAPIPSNWGNANTWDEYARASGYHVSNVPAVGSIFQYDGGGEGIYHVAFVERVDADGTVVISEMNVAGWNRLSERTFTAAQAAAYDYIH